MGIKFKTIFPDFLTFEIEMNGTIIVDIGTEENRKDLYNFLYGEFANRVFRWGNDFQIKGHFLKYWLDNFNDYLIAIQIVKANVAEFGSKQENIKAFRSDLTEENEIKDNLLESRAEQVNIDTLAEQINKYDEVKNKINTESIRDNFAKLFLAFQTGEIYEC